MSNSGLNDTLTCRHDQESNHWPYRSWVVALPAELQIKKYVKGSFLISLQDSDAYGEQRDGLRKWILKSYWKFENADRRG